MTLDECIRLYIDAKKVRGTVYHNDLRRGMMEELMELALDFFHLNSEYQKMEADRRRSA